MGVGINENLDKGMVCQDCINKQAEIERLRDAVKNLLQFETEIYMGSYMNGGYLSECEEVCAKAKQALIDNGGQ